jgi:type I restriction enzyme M protein
VQLIDGSELFQKLRKNLGAKNCEFAPKHIEKITDLYLEMPNQGVSKVFDNSDFGYYKVTVERPLRLAAQFTEDRLAGLRFAPAVRSAMELVYEKWGDRVYAELAELKPKIVAYLEQEEVDRSLLADVGQELWLDYNEFLVVVDTALKKRSRSVSERESIKLSSSEKNQLLGAVSWRDEAAARVVKKLHKLKYDALADLLHNLHTSKENLADFGYWPNGEPGQWVEYEADSELRDTENVPLKEEIYDYFVREVRPHVEDAWIALDKTQIGYEISFNKYFYQHQPLRSLEEVTGQTHQVSEKKTRSKGIYYAIWFLGFDIEQML